MSEDFKPIPVRRAPGLAGALLYHLRMAGDLQLLTCTRFLKPRLARVSGALLDVGCGEMPFRPLIPEGVRYQGVDVEEALSFGMRKHSDLVYFDGYNLPFDNGSFDCVLCTEVLEHVEEPSRLVSEMLRVLKPGGTLLATIPFAARVHHAPHDFQRFTRYGLASLFAGFADVEICERGSDWSVIANKLIALDARYWLVALKRGKLQFLPSAILVLPFAVACLGLAHLSLAFQWGSKDDPLGYGIVARKVAGEARSS